MTFNIFNILIIVGIIQGFIFTGVFLFSKKYHAKSTFYLVALIVCYSLGNLMYILPDIGAMSLWTMYGYFYIPFASIDAPILYFYVILFLYPSKKILTIEKLLFAPFIIVLILALFFRVRLFLGLDAVDPINSTYGAIIVYTEMFSVVFSIVLISICLHKTFEYEKKNKQYDKTIIRSDIKWLKITLSIILLFTFLWAYLTFRNLYVTSGETIYYSLWLGLALMIYWLGHIGVYKYGIIADRNKIRKYVNEKNTIYNKHTNNSSGYSSSKHTNEYIDALEKLLLQEKIYLDSNLTLDTVASNLNLSSSYLSKIIHNELNTSFPDYLNSFRIEEAKNYLKNPDFAKYTIVSIGLEAGFNSKSSFYNVFKKYTGKTPMAYKKDITTA
ncbi:MAG TPA: AraC family transcriptional regulator [Flavobacteriaceae bacterium]|nr:AraC family transcriptional regulator [Flavobacteriaceae bacterium]